MKVRIETIQQLQNLTRELGVILRNLDLVNNFAGSKIEEVVLPASSETIIRNTMTFIPSHYIIVKQTGNGLITKGDTPWTTESLYLKNNGSTEVTISIKWLK